MTLDNCPGCSSRMVNGVCSMCGYIDTSHIVATDNESETTFEKLDNLQESIDMTLSTALIDCPACSNRVSENAATCPRCGFVLTPAIVSVQSENRDKKLEAQLAVNLVGMAFLSPFVLILIVLIYLCVPSGFESSSSSVSTGHTTGDYNGVRNRDTFDSSSTVGWTGSLPTKDVFYDPRREPPYMANHRSFHNTRRDAISVLAEQFDRSTAWIEANMGMSNDLKTIHYNLSKAYLEVGAQTTVSDVAADDSYYDKSDLAGSKKQKLFFELVAAQDAGVGDERAYFIIAERYNISVDAVRQIGVEGAVQDWPMP